MALESGIYVCFLESASNQGGQSKAGVVRLGNEGPGGITYLDTEQMPGLGNGIVACRGPSDDLLVFVADNTQQVWQITFNGQKLTSAEKVQGVKTNFEMGAIHNSSGTHLYYITDQKGYVVSKTNGPWSPPRSLNLKSVNDGISVVEHNGTPVLCYQTEGNKIIVQKQGQEGTETPYTGWSTPRIASYGSGLFLVWHSSDTTGHCWSSRYIGNNWTEQKDAPGCTVFDSPSVCSSNNIIYCFTKGGGNHIYYQLFANGIWIPVLMELKARGGETLSNIWHSPFALSV